MAGEGSTPTQNGKNINSNISDGCTFSRRQALKIGGAGIAAAGTGLNLATPATATYPNPVPPSSGEYVEKFRLSTRDYNWGHSLDEREYMMEFNSTVTYHGSENLEVLDHLWGDWIHGFSIATTAIVSQRERDSDWDVDWKPIKDDWFADEGLWKKELIVENKTTDNNFHLLPPVEDDPGPAEISGVGATPIPDGDEPDDYDGETGHVWEGPDLKGFATEAVKETAQLISDRIDYAVSAANVLGELVPSVSYVEADNEDEIKFGWEDYDTDSTSVIHTYHTFGMLGNDSRAEFDVRFFAATGAGSGGVDIDSRFGEPSHEIRIDAEDYYDTGDDDDDNDQGGSGPGFTLPVVGMALGGTAVARYLQQKQKN